MRSHSRAGLTAVFPAILGSLLLGAPSAADAECPGPGETGTRLAAAGLERSARTARFSTPPPLESYEKAARNVGRVEVRRDGDKGFAVVVAPLPVEVLWRAINDEDAHDEGGFLPLVRSEIVGGTPRGVSRRVFQAGQKIGLGRWWLTRTTMNGDLFEASGKQLWEVAWEDDIREAERRRPPVDDPPDLSPIEWSRGAWLLMPLSKDCTFLEHFSWSDPGGFVGMMQGLVLGRALRESVEGMVELAGQRYRGPVDGPPFVAPDGIPLTAPPPAGP